MRLSKKHAAALMRGETIEPEKKRSPKKPKKAADLEAILAGLPARDEPLGLALDSDPRMAMNGVEKRYYAHLISQFHAGHVRRVDRCPENFRLAENTYYLPDFRVVLPDGTIEFHETKGTKRKTVKGPAGPALHHEKGWLKLKIAAALHPMYRFLLVWWDPDANRWMKREV